MQALARAEAGKGGIDRIMIFDHGLPGYQEFGQAALTPDSAAWKTISAAINPYGSIVFTGCEVAAKDDVFFTGEEIDGKEYVDSFYLASGQNRPVIHAYEGKVQHAEDKLKHSKTPGKEYSTPAGRP